MLRNFNMVCILSDVNKIDPNLTFRSSRTPSVCQYKHQSPDQIIDLLSTCVKSTYFQWRETYYQQSFGTPMGSPISPILANIFMEDFEQKALETARYKPKLWLRYVDDTFIIWQHGSDKLSDFLDHLNQQHPRIQFTMKTETGFFLRRV